MASEPDLLAARDDGRAARRDRRARQASRSTRSSRSRAARSRAAGSSPAHTVGDRGHAARAAPSSRAMLAGARVAAGARARRSARRRAWPPRWPRAARSRRSAAPGRSRWSTLERGHHRPNACSRSPRAGVPTYSGLVLVVRRRRGPLPGPAAARVPAVAHARRARRRREPRGARRRRWRASTRALEPGVRARGARADRDRSPADRGRPAVRLPEPATRGSAFGAWMRAHGLLRSAATPARRSRTSSCQDRASRSRRRIA